MSLPNSMLREFAAITNDSNRTVNAPTTTYGKCVVDGDRVYVQFDGSEILTPVTNAMDAKNGDRVIVTVKDHKAVITGNMTMPATDNEPQIIELGEQIEEEMDELEKDIEIMLKKTEQGIIASVSGYEDLYDTSSLEYKIRWSGIGYPDLVSDKIQNDDYYLDSETGEVYKCIDAENFEWEFVETLEPFQRSVSATLEILKNSIASCVTNDSFTSNIQQLAQSISSKVSSTELGNAVSGLQTEISQTAHTVSIIAKGGDESVGISIRLYDENGNIIDSDSDTANITFTGIVRYTDIYKTGTTQIDGGRIDTETLVAKKGEFKEFTSSVSSFNPNLGAGYAIYREILNVDEQLQLRCRGYWRAQNGAIYNGDTHIDVYPYKVNIVTFGGATGQGGVLQVNGTNVVMPSDLSVYATKTWVNNQGFSKSSVDLSSYLTKTSASSTYMPKSGGTFSGVVTFDSKSQCNANINLGSHYIQYNNSNGLIGYDGSYGQIGIPSGTNVLRGTPKLGSSSGSAVTSDERLKYDFGSLESYEEFFMDLKPLTYKYKAGNTGRKHVGFGAKAILDNLEKHNISTNDFGGYIESQVFICEDETEEYKKAYEDAGLQNGDMERSLRYEEFIALNTHMIQKLYSIVEMQDQRIKELENKLQEDTR